ncbi:TPA: fimbria/pilus outer membrane usher protein [Salmonella enterica]|uniref:Fimbria/pilus outer membrane usher protein n=2 Tax=Salmonella enterica TaxID=28901 RepID=A0A761EY26_SALER|nr:fimbria/pilus outer membrane usher protein [Salmonella enterica subsp. enterica serovar Reading]HAF7113524.1 fimbria/pilus outer membrane usher protein [Salmonella enterica]HAF8192376.1 fimbria/pilus outer membrane usher protein [Salmonella enterica]HAF8215697.1 fimbria/pilus outer membrane usher protein [Salmonella enterica]HAF8244150.1 fimbria/pilus outer membrane usher protein [Salmonella enterica]
MKKTILSLFVSSVFMHGSESIAKEYIFDYASLNLEGYSSNLFNESNLLGNYVVDVYVNNELKETAEIYFREQSMGSEPCITKMALIKYGFIREKVNDMSFNDEQCLIFNDSGIEYRYNASNQILLLKASDKILSLNNSEIADEALWDEGINAFVLNYKTNYSNYNTGNSEIFFSQIEPGFNYGSWRFRNLSTWQKNGDNDPFQSAYTYAERGINSIKSRLIIGDKQTTSDIFDSVTFRGVSLSKDENMIPHAMKKYSPKITGIARSQAVVEIRQDGYLLYSTSVPPGVFDISNDKFTNIGSGTLEVTVIEADGQRHSYSVVYSIPIVSLPEGYSKYSITAGKYQGMLSNSKAPFFAEGTYSRGLPYGITFYAGAQWADIYSAYAIGISKDISDFGAFSFDWKISNTKNRFQDNTQSGHAYGVRYNKKINPINTDISLASHYFYSNEYRSLSEAAEYYEEYKKEYYNKKSATNFSISQPLGKYGSLGLSYNYDTYWKKDDRTSITARYSKRIYDLSLSLAYTKNDILKNNKRNTEDLFSMMFSIPLTGVSKHEMYTSYQLTSSSETGSSHDFGISGVAFDRRLSWQMREQVKESSKDKTYSYLNALWRGTYGEIDANYSYSNSYQGVGLNASGGLIVHEEGITFAQTIPSTAALVETKGISGAKVIGYPGIKTGYNGNTISSSLSPYMENLVSIDPVSLPNGSEIRQTDIKVVPTTGAIVKAKYKTSIGTNALMEIVTAKGTPLAFGSVISIKDKKNGATQSTSIVGEHGEAYISGLDESVSVSASWGKKKSENCTVTFSLPRDKPLNQSVTFLKGVCK